MITSKNIKSSEDRRAQGHHRVNAGRPVVESLKAKPRYNARAEKALRKTGFSAPPKREDGRHGDHGGGGIYERDSVAGVDLDGGPLERLKTTFVEKIGYTAGAMGL